MLTLQRTFNIIFILVLCFVLASAFAYQIIKHEEPCPLCYLQRLSMMGISISLLMNLRFGIKAQHYGLAIVCALLGEAESLRQILLHICPQFPVFGEPVFGFDLYMWAFIVFTLSIFSCAVLLMIKGYASQVEYLPTWSGIETATFILVCLLILGNIGSTYYDCGLSACGD